MCCGCLALRGTQLGSRGPCLDSLPSARKGHGSLGVDLCVCGGVYVLTPAIQTERPRNHQPPSSPSKFLPQEHRLFPRAPWRWSCPPLGSDGSGQGRQGHAAAPLCPRGHSPSVRVPAGRRGASPGMREGARPSWPCLAHPARGGTRVGSGPRLVAVLRDDVKRRALCGRLSAASGGAFQPLWYAKWLLFTAAAAAGGKG